MKTKKYLFVLITMLVASFSLNAAIFTVNSNLDTDNGLADNSPAGSNTLRKCIRLANAVPNSTINFGLANAINTITITNINALKITASGTIIDGFSNPGALANTSAFGGTLNPTYRIKITSQHGAGFDTCINVTASNCVIKGLVISEFGVDFNDVTSIKDFAIALTGNGNTVEGCFIGCGETAAFGSGSLYQSVGILVTGNNNKIGGTTVAGKNLISGNTYAGIIISGAGATGNKVVGNYLGSMQKDGKTPITDNSLLPTANPIGPMDTTLGRQYFGVRIVGNASSNLIGDTTSASYDGRNCISLNIAAGVAISEGANNNIVRSNIIGLAVNGTTLFNRGSGNVPGGMGRRTEQGYGVQLGVNVGHKYAGAAVNNTIGGVNANQRNIITGNFDQDQFPYYQTLGETSSGVYFAHAGTINNTVKGNYIGTINAGTAEPSPGPDGLIYQQTRAIMSSTTASGGGNRILNNLISGNADGIVLFAGGYTIQGNTIGPKADGITGFAIYNQTAGITLETTATQKCIIGGSTAAQRNILSGLKSRGIFINHNGPAAHRIIGNYIGTNINGTAAPVSAALGQVNGIEFNNPTSSGDSVLNNVISYNRTRGIKITGSTGANYIFGNTIGLQSNGTTAGATQEIGIEIIGTATNVQIGGSVAGQGNVISGNLTSGITIGTTGAALNIRILGNIIGATSTLANPTGNSQDYGIQAAAGSSFSASRIGGTTSAGEGNTIAFNTVGGILLNNVNNKILIARNLIYSNPAGATSKSINLNALANNNRVAPTISTATTTGVSGTSAVANDVIQIYKNTSAGANCQDMNVWVGTATASAGAWSLTVTLAANEVVIAIASDNANTVTSATSACKTVTGGPAGLTLNLTALIEGYYSTATATNITVELRNSATALVTSKTGTLSGTGTCTLVFPAGTTGVPYYIVIKHANALETWSNPFTFATTTQAYDFTTASSKAYNAGLGYAPMKLKGTKWCFYSGDVNQDGVIEGGDYTDIFNDAFIFKSGPIVTDLNGDDVVETEDATIGFNNSGFIESQHP